MDHDTEAIGWFMISDELALCVFPNPNWSILITNFSLFSQ